MFSGQGAQVVGMAKDLYDSHEYVRELFSRADEALGFGLTKIMFEGPMEELTKTDVCQPALYLHGIAAAKVLERDGKLKDLNCAIGLSLGELTAHCLADTYDFETGLKIVAERGRLMQVACDSSKGSMASFIGATREDARKYCEEFDVEISNVNCPGQIVISGEAEKIATAVKVASERKSFKMVIPLKVAGAYHSRLMEPARSEFEKYLDGIEFRKPKLAVFTNVTGELVNEPSQIKKMLVKQVVSSVMWEDCIKSAKAMGVTEFFECGPGKTLTGLLGRM